MYHYWTHRKDIYVSLSKATMVGHSILVDSTSMTQFLPKDQVLRYHHVGVMILVYEGGW